MNVELWLVTTLILLLVTANGAPVIASLFLGERWNWPLDNNIRFTDQRPLLGASKTLRGLVTAIISTAVVAALLGIPWVDGACFGLLAMLGDLCSSFIKRRLGFPSSRSVPLLDQLPESVLPIWMIQTVAGATITEKCAAVTAFIVIDLLLSRFIRPDTAR